jgi:RecB family exonuclease
MRLAYTATTRAKSRVVWTATDAALDESELRPSRFMMAAAGSEHLGPPAEVIGEPISIREAETMLRRTVSDPGAAPASRAAAAAALAAPEPGWWDPAAFAGIQDRGKDSPIRDPKRRLSPSQASTYDECPRRYAVERVLEMGADSGPYASFGTVLHDVMEHAETAAMERGARNATLEEALASLDEIWVDGAFGATPVDAAWKSRARTFLERIYTLWPSSGSPVALELAVEKEVGNVVWRGRVDRVEREPDGQLKVIDYKTSKTLPSVPDAASSIQLGFYVLAVEDDSRVQGLVGAAEFWHPLVAQKGLATRSFDIEKVDEISERLEAITASVVEEDWRPRPGAHCARCQIKSSCPAWPEGRESFLA